jgi:hypothetical protein
MLAQKSRHVTSAIAVGRQRRRRRRRRRQQPA